MLFSISLFVVLSNLCLLTKQTGIKESHEAINVVHNVEQPPCVETMQNLNHQVQEPISNYQSKEKFLECRKNQASSNGVYTLDGCGEFLPAGVEGTNEFFKCDACNCHRNFHRKEIVTSEPTPLLIKTPRVHQPTPITTVYQTPNGYTHVTGPSSGSTAALAFPSTIIHGGEGSSSSAKKRFRTKFTHEQKEKMLEFATKIGWRIQKQDQNDVQTFCNDIGVKYHVFKVWMINNKKTNIGKKA